MSHKNRRRKKLRNPSPEAVADFVKQRQQQMEEEKAARETQRAAETAKAARDKTENLDPAERRRAEDEAWLASLDPETRAAWADAGTRIYDGMTRLFMRYREPMIEEEVIQSLDTCTRFLTQLADCAGGLLETLDTQAVRRIVAADVPLTESMRRALSAAGIEIDQPPPAEEGSPQKRPRGARHPLMAFFNLAVQASRLVCQITRGAWPHAHNLFTREEREDRAAARHGPLMQAGIELEKLERMSAKLR